MSLSPLDYLRHILDETRYVLSRARGVSRDEFLQDETLQRAFVRSLEIIGEATKHVPAEFRQRHGQVDWRAMAAMRDRLIHDYLGVDYEIVWDAVAQKLPDLEQEMERILQDEANG
jgi:uncharacterized protein with HEPN domain